MCDALCQQCTTQVTVVLLSVVPEDQRLALTHDLHVQERGSWDAALPNCPVVVLQWREGLHQGSHSDHTQSSIKATPTISQIPGMTRIATQDLVLR